MNTGFFRTGSLAFRLYSVFAIFLTVASVLSAMLLVSAWRDLERGESLLIANAASDDFISASAEYARERATGGLVLAHEKVPAELAERLRKIREKGDTSYRAGMEKVELLLALDSQNEKLENTRGLLLNARRDFEEGRAQIDSHISSGGGELQPRPWLKLATRHIDRIADMRIAGIRARNANELALAANLRVKHLVWLVSEYAGRERGNMTPLINDRKPVPPELAAQLVGWRAVVEQSLREIGGLRSELSLPAEFRASIDHMEKTFQIAWTERRAEILKASDTGQYPVDSAQWVKESTAAIDSVLGVAEAASKMSGDALGDATKMKYRTLLGLLGVLIFVLVLSFAAVVFVRSGLVKPLTGLIDRLCGSSEEVNRVAHQVASTSERLSHASNTQSSALVETSSSMEELSAMVARNNESASHTAEVSVSSEANAKRGQEIMAELRKAIDEIRSTNERLVADIQASNERMNEVTTSIQGIRDKTKLIDDIVFQTKLLSFNASVEAARAGEQGKGFAVVAEEVGVLARTSGEASRQIGALIGDSVAKVDRVAAATRQTVAEITEVTRVKVEHGLRVAEECERALADIAKDAMTVRRMVDEIQKASSEQSTGVAEINRAVHSLEQTTQEAASTSSHAAESANGLSRQAEELNEVVHHLTTIVTGVQVESERRAA